MCERAIRTIMEMMSRIFQHRNTLRWKDILKHVVSNYNHKIHRAHGFSPNDATKPENQQLVWNRLYQKVAVAKHKKPKYTKDQRVRISLLKGSFEKGKNIY